MQIDFNLNCLIIAFYMNDTMKISHANIFEDLKMKEAKLMQKDEEKKSQSRNERHLIN